MKVEVWTDDFWTGIHAKDSEGLLWFARPDGVCTFDLQSGSSVYCAPPDGLEFGWPLALTADWTVWVRALDKQQRSQGVVRIQGDEQRLFTTQDGLLTRSCRRPKIDYDGRVWFFNANDEGIIGLYLNDFYDEIEDGHRTMEQWREIIAAAKSVNPDLALWVPHYPHRGNEERAFDIDYQGVIFNIWDPRNAADADRYLAQAEAQHAGKTILGGLYLSSGPRRGRWLTEENFKSLLQIYVDQINAGRLHGLRIFSAGQLDERPEYVGWAKEVLAGLKTSP